jgi:mannosyltransferase
VSEVQHNPQPLSIAMGTGEGEGTNFISTSLPLRASALMLLVLLLAALLRFHNLGAQSLWNDEGNSYVQSTRGFFEIADHAARDIHPPGYYWLLAGWRSLTGETEFALRSLSAFASILTVAFTFALGRRLYNNAVGLLAALLVALNTFQIYYGQEARMYALLALWGAASMLALAGFLKYSVVGARRVLPLQLLIGFALLNAAGLWTQYAYPIVIAAQGVTIAVWLLTSKSAGSRRASTLPTIFAYILANILTLLLYLPWLPTFYRQYTTWPNTGDGTPLNQALGVLAGWFTFGVTYTQADGSWVAVALLFLLFGLLVLPYRKNAGHSWAIALPIAWVALSIGIFLGTGRFRLDNIKVILPAQIGFALWMARGMWVLWDISAQKFGRRVPRNAARLAAVAGTVGLIVNLYAGVSPLYTHPDYQRADYRGIVRDIQADLREGDAVVLDAPNQEEVFRYYYSADAHVYTLPPGLGGNDAATRSAVEDVINAHQRLFVVFWGEAERDPNRIVEGTLDTQTFEVGDQWYGDVRLARYVMPAELTLERQVNVRFGDSITLQGYALNADDFQPGDVLQARLDWLTDESLETRYKVFLQLLNRDGVLVAQRDSEPGGGLTLTTTWTPGETVQDNHGLLLPDNLTPGEYQLIVGLYDLDNPSARLTVDDDENYLPLATIRIL